MGVGAPDLSVPSPPLSASCRGPTSRVAQMVAGSSWGGEGRAWARQGPKTSAPRTVLGVQHTWHPGLTICSELTAAPARGVGLERDKDTAWGVDGFASTAAMNSVNQRLWCSYCVPCAASVPSSCWAQELRHLFGYTLKLEKNPVYIVV